MSAVFGRVGVFGSLLNPPHLGHLILCSEAADQLGLERVVLVPTGAPPHRPAPAVGTEARYRLAVAAARTDPRLTVSRVEVDRPGPSYMVDTLTALADLYAAKELVLLLGADQLAALGAWHEAERIPHLARIAVAPRPGVTVAGLEQAAVQRIDMPLIGISSSAIRRRVAEGRSIRHLVPDAVRVLIEEGGLYRETPPGRRASGARATAVVAWNEDHPPVEER